MSTDRGMDKEDAIYEYIQRNDSVVKKSEIMSFAATWMDPEIIILTEVSQTKMKVAQSCLIFCDPMVYTQSMEFSRPEYWDG